MSDPPQVPVCFANNFWGERGEAGVGPLLDRMHNAKVTCDEIKAFYNARATLEEDYSRRLLALSKKPLGSVESGTLRSSLDVVRGEVESMGKTHQAIASQMKTELEEPLAAFSGGMKERRKIVQAGIEKLLKIKVQQTHMVNKARDRYEQDCLRIKGYLAQGHMVMGQEERKNKAKLEKTQIQMATTSKEYEAAVKDLEETFGRWNRDWKIACDKFQDLEEERLDFTKNSMWNFANIASTVCVTDDASCEKIRLSLELCDVEKDITNFIQDKGTGQEIPDPPKYINFARGDIDDSASESTSDDGYSVAQFQRAINPAYRSSSPQPSMYESHHDPHSTLAMEMGMQDPATPSSRETTVTPKKPAQEPSHDPSPVQMPPPQMPVQRGTGKPSPQRNVRSRVQQYQQTPHGTVPVVPHNEYPADGMTMFCRAGPPGPSSDSSSAMSPVRPSSSDSHSEYSNPTSFSSMDPPSAKQSPTKPKNPPSQVMDKDVQKKRSGFFSNSPFRRKSKHERDSKAVTPTFRATWGPTNRTRNNSQDQNSLNSRAFRQAESSTTVLGEKCLSTSPEPVDPRANFQLNVGNNVFDVASPDAEKKQPKEEASEELDPIAQALAELKGATKQSSGRVSADRYHGITTPSPGNNVVSRPAANTVDSTQHVSPPPSYNESSTKMLDPPRPAFTSTQMQKTTRKYIAQTQNMFGGDRSRPGTSDSRSGATSRPNTRGSCDIPRASSPVPPRTGAMSPRPGVYGNQHQQRRSQSPNPYAKPANPRAQRPSQSVSPVKRDSYNTYSRHNSPSDPRAPSPQAPYQRQERPNEMRRAASPNPQFSQQRVNDPRRAPSPQPEPNDYRRVASPQPQYARQVQPSGMRRAASPRPRFSGQYERPVSSAGMQIQLAQPNVGDGRYDNGYNSQRSNRSGPTDDRPLTLYGGQMNQQVAAPNPRARSKSMVDGRQFTRDGRVIMHFARAMYSYKAAIPEELSFSKGDVLAVLRHQDDGWWEAEVTNNGRGPGLVPSNYLQNC